MKNVTDGLIGESKASGQCGTFIRLEGNENDDITLRNINVKKASGLIDYENDSDKKAVEIK